MNKSAEVVKLVTQELGGKMLADEVSSKSTSFLDPDGWKIVSFSTAFANYYSSIVVLF